MKKEIIIKKLTSRKLWMALASFVSMLMIYRGADANSASEVAGIIGAFGTVIGYLLAEGLSDAGNQVEGVENGK